MGIITKKKHAKERVSKLLFKGFAGALLAPAIIFLFICFIAMCVMELLKETIASILVWERPEYLKKEEKISFFGETSPKEIIFLVISVLMGVMLWVWVFLP
jgi:asparagine N-glycosylation enzyme membrane subunit Stt3